MKQVKHQNCAVIFDKQNIAAIQ